MAGAVKHMERSHKTHNKNYTEFRKFSMRALSRREQRSMRKTVADTFVKSVVEPVVKKVKKLFSRKHQDR